MEREEAERVARWRGKKRREEQGGAEECENEEGQGYYHDNFLTFLTGGIDTHTHMQLPFMGLSIRRCFALVFKFDFLLYCLFSLSFQHFPLLL